VAGLAALDLMQRARATWQAAREGRVQYKLTDTKGGPGAGRGGVHLAGAKKGRAPKGLGGGGGRGGWEGGGGRGGRGGRRREGVGREGEGMNGHDSWGGEGAGKKGKGSKGAKLIKDWRDMFNNLVRWRQLSEPVDTIAWVDGLG